MARALLIGRGALVVLGLPPLTADNDFWLHIDDIWPRRSVIESVAGITVSLPALDDLIATKRFVARPEDLEDIRQLEALRDGNEDAPRRAGGRRPKRWSGPSSSPTGRSA